MFKARHILVPLVHLSDSILTQKTVGEHCYFPLTILYTAVKDNVSSYATYVYLLTTLNDHDKFLFCFTTLALKGFQVMSMFVTIVMMYYFLSGRAFYVIDSFLADRKEISRTKSVTD